MQYWKEVETTTEEKKQVVKELTKEDIINTLETIDRGYLPDWNYETREDENFDKISLPNEYYPLHVAMQVAIRAVEAQGEEFFKEQDRQHQ